MSTKKGLFVSLLLVVGLLFAALPSGQAQAAITTLDCTAGCTDVQLQSAIDGASDGDTINVSGTIVFSPSTSVTVSKDVTLDGGDSALIQVSGTGYSLVMNTDGATLQGFQIQKTDKTDQQQIIYIAANNLTVANNEIWGQWAIGDGEVSRAFVTSGGFSGLNISGNEIYALRQPGYVSGLITGNITNNYVHGTKGWVLEGGNLTFTGNTWAGNVGDIAIIPSCPAIYYTDILALSAANNGAVVEDQRVEPRLLSVVYVDDSAAAGGNGTQASPYQTIDAGIARVIPGGTVHVAAGSYVGVVTINKSLTLVSTDGAATTIINGGATTASPTSGIYSVEIRASNVTFKGFTVTNPLWNGGIWGGDPAGIMIGYYGDNSLSNIRVTENIVTQIGDPTDTVEYAAPAGMVVNGVVAGLEIDHNVVHDIAAVVPDGYGGTTGIGYYGYDTTPLSTNVSIHDNEIYDIRVTGNPLPRGIRTGWGAGSATISANNIHDFAGIGVQTNSYTNAAVTISSNTITNTAIGVSMEHPVGGSITDNTISGNGTGIQLGASVTTVPTISGNDVNMAVLQFHDGSTAEVVDMATVYAANTWAPFSIISGRDILVPAPVHNVTKDTYFGTIQAAIDDAGTTDGDVIEVRAGLYVENVNVNKEVTLLGGKNVMSFSVPVTTGSTAGPGVWYTDRYAPAVFETAEVGGEMVLKHGVRAADSAANRPAAYSSTFYNTQGRGYDLNLLGASQTVSIDLFVDPSWTSGQQNAGLWGVGVDGTPDISAYPILAWRNVTSETAGFYAWDYIDGGYTLLKAAAAGDYGKWHTLSFTLTPGVGVVYSVDGVSSSFADLDTLSIKSIILNVYNFGVDYDVLWDNLITPSASAITTVQGQMTINANNVAVDGFTLTNPNQPYGIYVNPGFAHIDITNNIFEAIGGTAFADNVKGIYLLYGPDDILIEGNTFKNLNAGTKSVNAIYAGDSDATDPVQGLIIRNNSFTNIASATKGGYGILFNNKAGTEGVVISGNTFDGISGGWTHAIGLEGPTPGALVTGNTFKNLTAIGLDNSAVFFEDNPAGGTVQIEGNKFLHVGYGVLIHPKHAPYTYTVDASPNYWGSACGPTVAGANVGQNVTYAPWYTDEAMTTESPAATTYDFTPSTGTVAINAAIACAAPGSTFNFAPGAYSAGFVVPAGRDHMTLIFADDAVVTASSPCFAVGADFTTIKAENIGEAACVTVAGSNGIDVAAGLRNLTVDGLEIYGPGNDGIHYNGVIFDTVLKDNLIHDLAGNGVYFGAQPVALTPGAIDIHGNLFQNNGGVGITNPNGTAAIDATYNSWGDVAGPAAGDGVGPNVTATPFTHVDVYMVAEGTPWTDIPLNQVVSGQTITFKVMAHMVNAKGVDINLLYPSANLSVSSSMVGGVFPSFENLDTATPGTIWYYGSRGALAPVTGDVELFTVTFTGGTPGLALDMDLDETSDVFGMEGHGSSSNIYAAALLDSTVNVIDLPVIDIVPVVPQPGPYLAGLPIEFNITVTNVGGGNFADLNLDFTLPAGAVLQYYDTTTSSWANVTDPMDIGTLATGGTAFDPILPLFRVIFADPGTNTISVALMDLAPATDVQLATTSETFTLLGNFTITGTFSMQGRSTRAGIPVTLNYQDLVSYTDKLGTTINQVSYNLTITGVNGGNWLLTTNQPRYLNVIAANNKIVFVNGDETLNPLQLLGGNAVWTDDVINVNDASQVGIQYSQTTGVNESSLLDGDVNFDGKVNVQDLALVGGNFDKTSETAYGVGNVTPWAYQ